MVNNTRRNSRTPLLWRGWRYLGLFLILGLSPVFGGTINDWILYFQKNPGDAAARETLATHFKIPGFLVETKLDADYMLNNLQMVTRSTEKTMILAGLLEALGKYDQARDVLSKHLTINSRAVTAVARMGWLYYLQGKFKEALEWYDLAIQKDPQYLEGYFGRMLVMTAKGNNGEAKRIGNLILSRAPTNFYAAVRMGNILYGEELYKDALKYYTLIKDTPDGKMGLGLCHYALKEYEKARNYLYPTIYELPDNLLLARTVYDLQQREMADLKWQLESPKLTDAERINKKLRLAFLMEAMESSLESREYVEGLLPPGPDFDQHIRIASILYNSQQYGAAGKQYEIAAAKSPQPRYTILAAIDCYIMARKFEYAQTLLDSLAKEKPGYDLDRRQAWIYMRTKQVERGRQIFYHGAQFYEKLAVANPLEARQNYLKAIDAYLAGKMYPNALAVIRRLQTKVPAFDLDLRLARIAFEQKEYRKAIEIYDRYLHYLPMQISKGWAYYFMRQPKRAETVFRDILKYYPDHSGALRGLQVTFPIKSWEAMGVYTVLRYGKYQDSRGLKTGILGYNYKGLGKAVTTLSYTRTDVIGLTPGNADFQEDLYGLKFLYRWDHKWATQLQTLSFNNNDAVTDGTVPWGMTSYFYPDSNWTLSLETDSSKYNGAYAYQVMPGMGYRFNHRWKLDLIANYIRISGAAVRASVPRDYTSAYGALTYDPNKKLTLVFSGWVGDRKMAMDSENLYSYNALDHYQESGSFTFLYKFKQTLHLYGRFAASRFESEWQQAANETAGTQVWDPNQTVRLASFGLDGFF